MAIKLQVLTFFLFLYVSFTKSKSINDGTISLEAGPMSQAVKIGQNTTLQCMWSKISPDCYWIKNGFPLILNENKRYIVHGDNTSGSCLLEIIGVQPADEGDWQCVFSKEKNLTASQTVKLIVDDNDYRRLLELEVGPKNTTVTNGNDVSLECKFSTPAPLCFWIKDGEMMAIRGRYQYSRDKFKGDCSIQISKINLLDDGLWQCGYPRSDIASSVKSPIANLIVHVTPADPVIVINGIPAENGEKIFISFVNKPPQISCWSENGNPESELTWALTNSGDNFGSMQLILSKDRCRVSESIKYRLKISELPLKTSIEQAWQQTNLTCIANHSTYEDGPHTTSVQLILGGRFQEAITRRTHYYG